MSALTQPNPFREGARYAWRDFSDLMTDSEFWVRGISVSLILGSVALIALTASVAIPVIASLSMSVFTVAMGAGIAWSLGLAVMPIVLPVAAGTHIFYRHFFPSALR
ncbi:MAG: hypothetical protein KDK62_01185 [Chlamydiia bacterium]|nr:hypothetical protein [Chlamydiia bacterium]